ncbi:type IV secretion system protein [Bordetella sp. 02P26C-1]|uniref:type IV secretion system protein n=1 Tax=Bordetella sp. 02P26C-1 TaxID=2683195 RepID=UPI00135535CF|nr:type IV secretion system protein [Bordetella sp. 02P26C-1]MVW78084.1 trwi protein [Bordetella sp. 02P26C-1]
MSAFRIFDNFFGKFDAATTMFATDISSKLIATLTPVISVGLALGFIVYALAIIRGVVDHPIPDFLWRCFRIGVIVSIATAGGLYQTQIADVITSTPDALATALSANPGNTDTAGNMLDNAAGAGLDAASKAFEKQGWFSAEGWLYGAFGIVINLATAVLVAIGGSFIILAKVALAVLAALGPFFILALLWQSTARFFEMWCGQVLNYGLLVVLTSIVLMLIMGIFGGYMVSFDLDGHTNAAYALGGTVIIATASIVLLLQLPSIAGGLAGGVGLGYMWEMRMLRSAMGSFGRKDKDGQISGRSGIAGASRLLSGAGAAGAKRAWGTGKKIGGYARGKLGR